jgi:hypothetical protein
MVFNPFGGYLSYNITRPVKIPGFKRTVLGIGLIYVVVITLINVVSQGYQTINYTSADFNLTHQLWYDRLVPGRSLNYSHRSCEPALIKLNDCTAHSPSLLTYCRLRNQQQLQFLPLPGCRVH